MHKTLSLGAPVLGPRSPSDYNARTRAEAGIGRCKQGTGDELRARKDECRITEMEVAVYTLNRMLDFARPKYVHTA